MWQSQPGEAGSYVLVRIGPCGPKVCGTIDRLVGNANQSIVGRTIIWDMEAHGNGTYRGGRIWAPDQDKTYRSRMTLNGDRLRVEGCVGPFCRTQTWVRVN